MKQPLKKDIYKELKYGKRKLAIISIIIGLLSLCAIAGGIALIVLGAINPFGAWQIVWRIIVGVIVLILGAVFLGIAITMFAVTQSMISLEKKISKKISTPENEKEEKNTKLDKESQKGAKKTNK